jgi:DNA (cytosine-5)-methyltransferase 1
MNEAAAYGWQKRGWAGPNLSEGIARIYVESKLPTPTTQDGKNTAGPSQFERNTKPLNVEVVMLPTTTASDWKGANHSESGSASSRGMATVVEQTNWGKFEPAIRRWEEVLGRPAPLPTRPDGKDGAHRLSSSFTEWMMGVPENWIVGNGLSRNDELKMCGNGVVPAQASLALRVLLEGITLPRGGGASESTDSDS